MLVARCLCSPSRSGIGHQLKERMKDPCTKKDAQK